MRGHERRKPGIGDADVAAVDDGGVRVAWHVEPVIAAHKAGIVDIGRGYQEAAYIDLRVPAEHHAVGIDQPDLPVGRERALDAGRFRVMNAVQGDAGWRGLVESHRLATS